MSASHSASMQQSPAMASPGLFLLSLALLLSTGCAWGRWGHRPDPAFGAKVPCKLPPHITAEEVVDHINQNSNRLQAWRAGRVKLRANGMPGLAADIAVEKDRHLRIVVTSVAGTNEVDIGCNDDVFWFWAKRQEPAAVMYASHDQVELVRETLQIPFEPDWLMEALGVAELSPAGVTLEHQDGAKTARLVSQHTTKSGATINKSITIDTCHGRVLEHSVWDANGRRIAHAEFSKHQIDPASGVVMPHHIKLEWPQAQLSLAMELGEVVVNPAGLPPRIWDMPHMPGYPLLNLQDVAERQRRGPVRQAAGNPPRAAAAAPADEDEFVEPLDLDAE